MSNGIVSTIITTYKRPDTLERAINSVLNQSYSEIEVIVVDDNDEMSDYRKETSKLMSKFNKNSRVIYIKHNKNLNGATARNSGLKVFNGEYVTFLDDDDFFHEKRFEVLIPILQNTDESTGAIFSGFQYYRNNNKYKSGKTTHSSLPVSDIMYSNFVIGSGSNFILKRNVISRVGGFDTNFERHQDVEFLVRVAEHFNFEYNDQILLNIQADSNTQNKISIDKMIKTKKQFIEKFDYLIEKFNLNREKILVTNLKGIVYLIHYYEKEKEYSKIIEQYKNSLSGVDRFFYYIWRKKIHLKNSTRKIFDIS